MKIQKFSELGVGDSFIFVDSDLFDSYVYRKQYSFIGRGVALRLLDQYEKISFGLDARVIKVLL